MSYVISPGQIKYIKTMSRQVFGGDDYAYREMLRGLAQVKSCKDLKGAKIGVVIRHLEKCLGRRTPERRTPPRRIGARATAEQLEEIRRRWDSISLARPWKREGALRKFLQRRFHVAAPERLTLPLAQKVIEGLKAMAARPAKAAEG